jgi:ribose 5-phosphate isomerase B
MKLAIAADHRGFPIKASLMESLRAEGHEMIDFGTFEQIPCDYPDIAVPACLAVVEGRAERALLADGSGIGVSIVANKVPGIRAALCHDELTAEISRHHNDANVICLAADLIGIELIRRICRVWLKTEFDNGRHARRNAKISQIEAKVFEDVSRAHQILRGDMI